MISLASRDSAEIIFKESGRFISLDQEALLDSWFQKRTELQLIKGILKLYKGELLAAKKDLEIVEAKIARGEINNLNSRDYNLLQGILGVGFLILFSLEGKFYKNDKEILKEIAKGYSNF